MCIKMPTFVCTDLLQPMLPRFTTSKELGQFGNLILQVPVLNADLRSLITGKSRHLASWIHSHIANPWHTCSNIFAHLQWSDRHRSFSRMGNSCTWFLEAFDLRAMAGKHVLRRGGGVSKESSYPQSHLSSFSLPPSRV